LDKRSESCRAALSLDRAAACTNQRPASARTLATVGAVAGATAGGIADDARPRFHSYVVERRHPSYRYQSDVRVGAELPNSGVTYYEVPREYGTTQYRYTVVNDRTVLVDPGTHRIVQIVD